jgi:hypothetical protein
MRSGDEVRVSTPVSTASGIEKPLIWRSKAGSASRMALSAVVGQAAEAGLGQVGQVHAGLVRGLHVAQRA